MVIGKVNMYPVERNCHMNNVLDAVYLPLFIYCV